MSVRRTIFAPAGDPAGGDAAAIAAAESWGSQGLKRTGVKSGAYTLAPGNLVPVDASGGAVPLTLPNAPADGARFAFKIILQAATPNAVTLATSGADVFNKAAGSTSLSFAAVNTAVTVQYDATSKVYTVASTDSPIGVASGAASLGSDGKHKASEIPLTVVLDSSASPKGIDSTSVADQNVLAYNAGSGKFKPTAFSVVTSVALGNRSTNYALSLATSQDIMLTATLTGSWILTFTSAPVVGQTITMRFTQDATGGRVVTLPGAVYPAGTFALNSSPNADTVITYLYDGTNWQATKIQSAAVTVPVNSWRPTGAVAETFPRNGRAGVYEAALLSGRMSLTGGAVIPANTPVNNLTFVSGSTAGATLTHMWAALISQDRSTILKLTADDTAASWSAATAKTFTLASTYTPSVDTPVLIGLVVVGGTMPTILGTEYGVNATGLAALEPIICANVNTAGITTPASFTSVGAVTASGTGLYAYAS